MGTNRDQHWRTGDLKCDGEGGGTPGCAEAATAPEFVRPNCCEGLVPLPSGAAVAELGAATAGLDCILQMKTGVQASYISVSWCCPQL